MSTTSIQDILPLVQMPSRYLGSEINRFKKKWSQTNLHIALAFPDLYEIATSHFGIQILYTLLNDQKDIMAERVFAPAMDMEKQLRQRKLPLCSLESEIPLQHFDIIGFSLLYELNYTNMINMLDLAGIDFYARRRKESDPIIIAGGPCTCNPEPVADFFDAIVIGDGEAVVLQLTEAWNRWRHTEHSNKAALLKRWSQIEGVYVPAFFELSDKDGDAPRLIPKRSSYRNIRRAVVADLDHSPIPAAPIIPFGRPVHDRLRMEIARGCTRGCRFCQAGMIYRPVRERHPHQILEAIDASLKETGYEDLSLLSLSTGDYSCIAPLMKQIMAFGKNDRIAVSLPSLRAGSITPELMTLIRKVRKTGFTIAPEAGSQRLRNVINKNISESDIFETVESAFSLGWKLIKLYFMIGLPTETEADLEAIVDMVSRLKTLARKTGNNARINVSIATFVPKPHTPFQWDAQIDLESAMRKLNWLKDHLNLPGVRLKWQDPRVSAIEGVWARGDRLLSDVLVRAWEEGCRFDGWTDYFDYDRWTTVFDHCGIDPKKYTSARLDRTVPLPWDHIHTGVERSYLMDERERAAAEKITVDCRTGSCSGCGVCDFRKIQPISHHKLTIDGESGQACESETVPKPTPYSITFQKMGPARFLGHLEMVKIFIRSLRRAEIPITYSGGFHPMPRISFADTLPMGMQSENERMKLLLNEKMDPKELIRRLQIQLPEGLDITACSQQDEKDQDMTDRRQRYHVELKDGFFQRNHLDLFFGQRSVNIERKNKRGKIVVVDLKRAVEELRLLGSQNAQMSLGRNNNMLVRPAQVLKTIFHLTEQQILTATITKLRNDNV